MRGYLRRDLPSGVVAVVSYYGSEIDQHFTQIKCDWERFARFMLVVGIVIGWLTSSLLWWWMGWLS